jgi:hypothetical protein
MAMHIIGIAGQAGAGKDTVCELLQERRAFVARAAFADALKAEVAAAFGVDVSLLNDRATKEVPTAALAPDRCRDPAFVRHLGTLAAFVTHRPRTIMQTWGDYRRRADPAYWLRCIEPTVGAARTLGAQAIVITDVRYPNEVEWLRAVGGALWRVCRPSAPAVAIHSSESAIRDEPADVTLLNESNLDALAGRVTDAYDDLVLGRYA